MVVTVEAADPCSNMIHIRIRKTCPSIIQYETKRYHKQNSPLIHQRTHTKNKIKQLMYKVFDTIM